MRMYYGFVREKRGPSERELGKCVAWLTNAYARVVKT